MCILLSTTSHPDYPIIILSNRDEFLARPTQRASIQPLPNGQSLLAPADLARAEHGTWIGVTSKGKIAVLLNYREQDQKMSKISRGLLPIEFLKSESLADKWHEELEELMKLEPVKLQEIGGFLLLYGNLLTNKEGKLNPLYLMSNRGDRGTVHSTDIGQEELHGDFATQTTFGLSNSLYYEPWPKVEFGRKKVEEMVKSAVAEKYTEKDLVEACFEILSTDTYDPEIRKKGTFDEKLVELKNSIFIPPLLTLYDSGLTLNGYTVGKYYGTRTQTVIAFHKSGTLHYYERDLYRGDSNKVELREQHYDFDITKI